MKKKYLMMIAVVIFTVTASFANHLITIVPYPKEVKVNIGFRIK